MKELEINHNEVWDRYLFEIKDCVILALNLIWDLCHEPIENKNYVSQNKTYEMTVIFILY